MNNRSSTKMILEEYLGYTPGSNIYYMLRDQSRKIHKIITFNKDIFVSLIKKNKRRFFSDVGGTSTEIRDRILKYFVKQQKKLSIEELLSIVELQSILVTTYTDVLGVLTTRSHFVYSSYPRLDFIQAEKIADDFLQTINVVEKSGDKVMGRHHTSELVDYINKLMEEYLRRHNKNCICYGSYSLYLINKDIKYGDIDIVQTNSRTFLIDLAFLIYFITGKKVVLLKVPFLKNYIVLQDSEGNHIIDSFNIRQETLQSTPKILIDNIYIVDPTFQLMSMLKMFSQIDRLEDLSERMDKSRIRLATLLEYVRFHHGIKFIDDRFNPMPMPAMVKTNSRIITVNTEEYKKEFGFSKCLVYLDENVLTRDILELNSDDKIVDFESISNSVFVVDGDTLYTYFSNTVLLKSENEIHGISSRALSAHILMYQILTKGDFNRPLSDLVNSLFRSERVPVFSVIMRDKKTGSHGIIDIDRDIITRC